jgi:hypothetical protein
MVRDVVVVMFLPLGCLDGKEQITGDPGVVGAAY